MTRGRKPATVRPALKRFIRLANHPRRVQLVIYIQGGVSSFDQSDCDPRLVDRLARDRDLYELFTAHGLAEAARRCGMTTRALFERLKPYRDAEFFKKEIGWGVYHEMARKRITPKVITDWRNGKMTAREVAPLLGPHASGANANYWLVKMEAEYRAAGKM